MGRSRGRPRQFDEDAVLPALARALERDPEPLLAELVPPFSLIWGRPGGDTLHVQTDVPTASVAPVSELSKRRIANTTHRADLGRASPVDDAQLVLDLDQIAHLQLLIELA